ncbi:MAG TPA: SpoIID/LytB domain-containing protein [Candidatus Acidoferrum sp.]|nr:SpoIID/LytB domain-containing protein [Candidatus Acidoferrum sp.]
MKPKKLLAAAALTLLLTLTAGAEDTTLRVGLTHSGGPVAGANALTETGYRLGYFGDDFTFFELATLENRFVTFAMDALVYISGNTVSQTQGSGAVAIKPYHLQVDREFESQWEAQDFLDRVYAGGFSGEGFVAYDEGYRVRLDMYSTYDYAAADAARIEGYTDGESVSAVGAGSRTVTVVDMNNYHILFELNPPYGYPAAYPMNEEDGETLKNGQFYYRGAFEFQRDGGGVTLVNVVEMSDYLKGVLPYEMSGTWPLEALKAQALCARTYAISSKGKHAKLGYDLCNTDNCQVYYGTARETDVVVQAVEETAGEIITYGGKPISTYYFSSSGGYTESAQNAWGGTTAPYCQAVEDTYEDPNVITHYSTTLTLDDLTKFADSVGANIGAVTDFYVSEYTVPAHNVYAVTFVGTKGSYTVSKTDNVRIKLNKYVRSARFDIFPAIELFVNAGTVLDVSPASAYVITGTGDVAQMDVGVRDITLLTAAGLEKVPADGGTYTIAGAGLGHNVGMSQYGAKSMAEQGFSYSDIIYHYFTDIEIQSTGD